MLATCSSDPSTPRFERGRQIHLFHLDLATLLAARSVTAPRVHQADASPRVIVESDGPKILGKHLVTPHIQHQAVNIEGRDARIKHPKTGMLLVLVPGGKFLAGGNEPFEVEVPAFYIGLTCLTNAQYGKYVREGQGSKPSSDRWKESGRAEHPVTDVTWEDAKAYCQWAGLKLPSELEWEKAARGLDGRTYPWGNEWSDAKCRHHDNRGMDTTCSVGEYPIGASPWGCLQMSGNIWEWCADRYDDKAYERYKRGELKGPSRGSDRVIRGGSWYEGYPRNFATFWRDYANPDSICSNRGFRCACDVV